MATPLDEYKHKIASHTAAEVLQHPTFGEQIAAGWEWVNLAFLAGGLLLIGLKIITWHIPVAFLAAIAVMSLAFGSNPDQYAPLQLHLLAGGTMLGAFFIATDPVSAATSHQGKLIYGAGIGVLVYLIRSWGNYPDAVAFSVLLMNFAVPFIDHYTPPRAYGQDRKSTRLNSSHVKISYAVFCLKKKPHPRGGRAGQSVPAAGRRGPERRARRAGQHHRQPHPQGARDPRAPGNDPPLRFGRGHRDLRPGLPRRHGRPPGRARARLRHRSHA